MTLTFYRGKGRRTRTDWRIHEYRLEDKELPIASNYQNKFVVLCKKSLKRKAEVQKLKKTMSHQLRRMLMTVNGDDENGSLVSLLPAIPSSSLAPQEGQNTVETISTLDCENRQEAVLPPLPTHTATPIVPQHHLSSPGRVIHKFMLNNVSDVSDEDGNTCNGSGSHHVESVPSKSTVEDLDTHGIYKGSEDMSDHRKINSNDNSNSIKQLEEENLWQYHLSPGYIDLLEEKDISNPTEEDWDDSIRWDDLLNLVGADVSNQGTSFLPAPNATPVLPAYEAMDSSENIRGPREPTCDSAAYSPLKAGEIVGQYAPQSLARACTSSFPPLSLQTLPRPTLSCVLAQGIQMSTSQVESTTKVGGSQAATPDSQGPLPSAPVNNSSNPILIENAGEQNDAKSMPDWAAKLRSPVWQHFTKEQINGVWKAVCKYCKKQLGGSSNNGTSHLTQHYNRKHKEGSMNQKVLTNNFNKENPQLTSCTFDHDIARTELASAIIMHEYPLSIVDHIGFKRYSASLQPLFKVPCRNTIKGEIFKIYDSEKAKTLSLVESNRSRLAITTDMWTSSNQKEGFMAVTAHFIDDSWTLQSRILRFIYVPCPHTKEALSQSLLDCLMDWHIDRKISCVTVDNASTNDAMVDILLEKLDKDSLLLDGTLFHMRCCAHILNLIVKDGLDVIKVSIEKIRESVAYWTATPKRVEKFEETARQLLIPSAKKLGLDCATRWNSTYLMLETALVYKDVFSCLKQRESQYKASPDDKEWEFAKEVCEKLKVFYKVTEVFFGTKYSTTNLCFLNICEIRMELRQWLFSKSEVIISMASKMVEKFDKYWTVIHGVVGVAAVLDPRYKMTALEFFFYKLFGDKASEEIAKVRKLCYDLLGEYQDSLDSRMEVRSESFSQSSSKGSETLLEYDLFVSRKRSKKGNYVKSELDHYLEDDELPRTSEFDVLAWWRSNAPKYPTLQAMARDMLAIPVFTVASKSAFSTSGRLVSPHRSRLHPKTMEVLMCAQSWLWAEDMKDKSSIGYATIYEDVDSEECCIIDV